MKKLIVPLSLILLLLISACGGSTPETGAASDPAETVAQATEASEAAPTEAPEITPTQSSSDTEEKSQPAASDETASAPAASAPSTSGEAGCHAESIDSLISLPPAAGIAPVSDADWQEKGSQAKITVIEYGDYQ